MERHWTTAMERSLICLSHRIAKLARVANRTVVMLRRRNSSDCRILTGKIPCNSASVLGIPTFFTIND